MTGEPGALKVEVAVAWPELQVVVPLEVPAGATVEDAIERSGLRERFPGDRQEQHHAQSRSVSHV